jgi:hypothetical protein
VRCEISRIEFSSDFNNRAIGINTLSIDNPAIPEPSLTMALLVMGSGLLCLKKGYDSGKDEPNFDGKIKVRLSKSCYLHRIK